MFLQFTTSRPGQSRRTCAWRTQGSFSKAAWTPSRSMEKKPPVNRGAKARTACRVSACSAPTP
jgi:hypothetical protein